MHRLDKAKLPMGRSGICEVGAEQSATPKVGGTQRARLLTRGESLPAAEMEKVRGVRVLMILAQAGHCIQEVLKPTERLETAGCKVAFASLEGRDVRFDPLCNALAQFERAWDPTVRLMRAARRGGRFVCLPSLREMADKGRLDDWLDGFAAVVVPGGHGKTFAAFLRDPTVIGVVEHFLVSGRVAALVCHAALIAALLERDGEALVHERTVTCWPRAYERVQGSLPFLGRYFMSCGSPVGKQLQERGGNVLDSILPGRRVHAVVDGNLVTGRGPWSDGAVATGLLLALARTVREEAPNGQGGTTARQIVS
jgi:putative intracellular protease/amidase